MVVHRDSSARPHSFSSPQRCRSGGGVRGPVLQGRHDAVQVSRHDAVDIGLDTFPYNGATTTCEALWMGVPVVTLVGKTHAARMGLSILSAVGLTELAAYTPSEYIEISVKLANHWDRLRQLRQTMRERMQTSALMDGVGFTHQLEAAYREMWELWCSTPNRG